MRSFNKSTISAGHGIAAFIDFQFVEKGSLDLFFRYGFAPDGSLRSVWHLSDIAKISHSFAIYDDGSVWGSRSFAGDRFQRPALLQKRTINRFYFRSPQQMLRCSK